MDESTTLWNLGDRSTSVGEGEEGTALGTLQTFIELAELRKLLGRLTAAELVQMVVAEAFVSP